MTPLTEQDSPGFTRGYRLQHDKVRDQWLIQAPERALIADPIAAIVLQLLDGKRSVASIIDELCSRFDAPRETIAHDVMALLSGLIEKRVLRL
ncbi:pyrroloquinoline quinone biosynthesis peptide chaperone PqqD [Saccharibacter sp. 17.LH.SD]|uniref:pyrroloquinoline quinone biosynthesis peptide chaperone PqqD n=1 Tax=Saccharibacter sp. 17.LH.SD TaxID=2689393 RepID=UPI00136C4FAC|nr:pyrroloquinoline quinone biosynthesis peptide chaperone PqqD [Saccharibacter sp. 17.LH.SD]MXV45212.1 pyrroloquinoline quinone biosynthesis peptide chaperone PqqD [Saccharibacter sp. 17.LH.SD]